MTTQAKSHSLFDPKIVRQAVWDSFLKLDPRRELRNPVMFTVYVGSILTTGLYVQSLVGKGEAPPGFILAISVWLWFTVLFANFAEAMAEGRGKAQADALRRARHEVPAKKLPFPFGRASEGLPSPFGRGAGGEGGAAGQALTPDPSPAGGRGEIVVVPAADLRTGDVVFVEAGDYVPADGEVIEGVASVDESAITGESAP